MLADEEHQRCKVVCYRCDSEQLRRQKAGRVEYLYPFNGAI